MTGLRGIKGDSVSVPLKATRRLRVDCNFTSKIQALTQDSEGRRSMASEAHTCAVSLPAYIPVHLSLTEVRDYSQAKLSEKTPIRFLYTIIHGNEV